MKKYSVLPFLLLLLTLISMTPKHVVPMEKQYFTVDFDGRNWAFKDLRTGEPPVGLYLAGDTVLLDFEMQATDESYTFYLDGVEINASYYNEQYGFCYHFVMPAHDVKLTWKSRNLMEE
jgi:hypothetical protein